ncbi:Ankyrin repeat containing protein [Balamuthia mandrillaris]
MAEEAQLEADLLLVAQKGGEDQVKELLQRLPGRAFENPCTDEKGRTALHLAVERQHPAIVALLLRAVAEKADEGVAQSFINRLDKEEGCAALHYAVRRNDAALVQLLLEAGADINLASSSDVYTGYTPLHFACSRAECGPVLAVLLQKPKTQRKGGIINVNARNYKGQTPLHVCCSNGHPSLATVLMRQPDLDLNPVDDDMLTPLMLSAATEREAFLKLLLNEETVRHNINQQDKMGDTALHHAFQIQLQRLFSNNYPISPVQEGIAYILVREGASLTIANKDKRRAIEYASSAFSALLKLVHSCRHSLPKDLSKLLSMTDKELTQLATHVEDDDDSDSAILTTDDVPQILNVREKYRLEQKKALEEEERRGACPFLKLQPRKLRPIDDDDCKHDKLDEEDTETESESESETDSDNDHQLQPCTPQKKSNNNDKEAVVPFMPSGHPSSGDVAQCPFFFGKKTTNAGIVENKENGIPASNKARHEDHTVQTSSHTTSAPSTNYFPAKQATSGGCPIPFHKQLVSPTFWLYVVVLIAAVLVARSF